MARDDEEERADLTEDQPPSASISKERAGGQDSRAVAHIGEDPDGPSTRITRGRNIAARIAEHEARVGHKEMDEEEAIRFEKGARRRRD